MVLVAVAELRPVFKSLAHTCHPFLALVLTVAVRGVGLVVTEPAASVPSASALAERAKEKVDGTVAVTTIWSLVTLAVLKPEESMATGPVARVVIVPVFELVAPALTVTAALFVQLKQYNVLLLVKSPLGNVTV
jgi:hypothetical protein